MRRSRGKPRAHARPPTRALRVVARVARGATLALAMIAAFSGCGGPATPRVSPSPRLRPAQVHDSSRIPAQNLPEWTRRPRHDYRQTLAISVIEGISGRGFEGRGALVVRPSRALRMILLGPGGATAMDVWIAGGRFRAAIPAIGRVSRGDARTPSSELRGLPIALLWRWVVDPFGGELVLARTGRPDARGAVVDDPTGRAFVAFAKRPDAFEIRARARDPRGIVGEGWWLEHGALVGHVRAEEQTLDDGGRPADFPAKIEYVSFDPPMTVRVNVEETAVLPPGAVPDKAFEDPDRP